jgi:hypothetical protein
METIVIRTNDSEESKMVKAVLKALRVKFEASSSVPEETRRIAKGIAEGYKESMNIDSGKSKAKTYSSFKEIFDDL